MSVVFSDSCKPFLKHLRAVQRAAYLHCIKKDAGGTLEGDDAQLKAVLSTVDIEKTINLTDFLFLLEMTAPEKVYFMADQLPLDFQNFQFFMADIGAGMESDAPLGQFEAKALFNAMAKLTELGFNQSATSATWWSTHVPDCPPSLREELRKSVAARGLSALDCQLCSEHSNKRFLDDGIDRDNSHQKVHNSCLEVSGRTAPIALWISDFLNMDVDDPAVVLRELRQEPSELILNSGAEGGKY